MRRFDQGSVTLSNLQVRRPGKGQTAATRAQLESVRPPNLVRPVPSRAHMRGRAHTHTHIRARTCMCAIRLDMVRRLDRYRSGEGFSRLTFHGFLGKVRFSMLPG